ncbi:MAG: hypothetical protein J5490_05125 [Bacteroidales bacterium]|nr:hypothetical protein [Bacteroidales bacterium]
MSKKITLYAYSIENEDISRPYSDFAQKFHEKLSTTKTIRQRYYEVNTETKEVDVLSKSVCMEGNIVYGALMRVIPSKEMPGLPEDYLDKEEISFSELEGAGVNNGKMSCKDLYYFILDNKHVVTTIPNSRISRFRAFVNHFLGTDLSGNLYRFSIMITQPENILLQDLTKIEFAGVNHSIESSNQQKSVGTQVLGIAKEMLHSLLGETDIQPLLDKKILTANLVVKFTDKGKKKMNEDEVKRAMSAVITNLSENEDVKFLTKDNKRIKAGETILIHSIDVDEVDNGLLNEIDLKGQMQAYLKEIVNLGL